MTDTLFIELVLIGAGSGVLAGLLGIGGGMVMVPILTFLLSARGVEAGLAVKMAIATSMAVIVFTSISSVRAHHKRGAVRWDIVMRLAPGIVLGSLVGSLGLFAVLKGSYLAIVFGVFVLVSATQMLVGARPTSSRDLPGTAGQVAAGSVIGLISGLVGAGGGFISVPYLAWCNVAIHTAVATSAALGFPIAITNVLGFVIAGHNLPNLPPGAFGYLWLPALGCIAAASVITAPWGARLAHNLPVATLKRIFACLLYILAIYMFWKGVRG
ncbi:sulfite exporter TauE/SafE family protein [Bordetella sp. BOR01]|uniref:sulfite exporter TauE/SafE family protein n=1 Tax=Bordetella sp. BOR01 TaxID=2854779 RepID=UPI00351D0319